MHADEVGTFLSTAISFCFSLCFGLSFALRSRACCGARVASSYRSGRLLAVTGRVSSWSDVEEFAILSLVA